MFDAMTGFRFREHDRYLELRYEDLICSPSKTMAQLQRFIGEECSITDLLAEANRRTVEHTVHATWTLVPGSALSADAMNKWKRLDGRTRQTLEEFFSRTHLSGFGQESLGLSMPYYGNDILALLGYDLEGWNLVPRFSAGVLSHVLAEKATSALDRRNLCCEIDLTRIQSSNRLSRC